MIFEAREQDIPARATEEAAIRIASLYSVYGRHTRFLRFFSDGQGRVASLMDGTACVYAPSGLNTEWEYFLQMDPSIVTVRCEGSNGRALATAWNSPCKIGRCLSYTEKDPGAQEVGEELQAKPLYALLASQFADFPAFESWYVDISHRLRHGHCRLAVIERDNKPVSTAMTVAETSFAVLLGSVATDPAWRCHGFAGKCLKSLIHRTYGKKIMIAAATDYAAALYEKYGFVSAGEWAQVKKQKG